PPARDHHYPVGGGEHLATRVPGVVLHRGQRGLAHPADELRHPVRLAPHLPHPHDHVGRRPPLTWTPLSRTRQKRILIRTLRTRAPQALPTGHTDTVVTGSAESAGRSHGLGGTPAATSWAPSAATIAPLSVQSAGRGIRSVTPAAAQRRSASARRRELAATPPPITRVSTPCSRQAATALAVSTSATASWKLAATSATGTGSPDRCRASTHRATAVFNPEKEKSYRCLARSFGAVSPRGNAIAAGSPAWAARSIGGPP